MAISEGHAVAHEPIDVRRVHIVGTERTNRVEPLLIGDDEDDVGTVVSHGISVGCRSGYQFSKVWKQWSLEIASYLLRVKMDIHEVQQRFVVTLMM